MGYPVLARYGDLPNCHPYAALAAAAIQLAIEDALLGDKAAARWVCRGQGLAWLCQIAPGELRPTELTVMVERRLGRRVRRHGRV
jgi:hypothetical protein